MGIVCAWQTMGSKFSAQLGKSYDMQIERMRGSHWAMLMPQFEEDVKEGTMTRSAYLRLKTAL